MAAKPRKRPARPAPEEAPPPSTEAAPSQPAGRKATPAAPPPAPPAPPAPQAPPADAPAPAATTPVQPPVAQLVAPAIPNSPEAIFHNILLRQLADDALQPPADVPANPALQTMMALKQARHTGQPLAPYQEELGRHTAGADASNRADWRLYRRWRNDQLVGYCLAEDRLDATLFRMFNRGDLTPTEVIVMMKVVGAKIGELAKELLAEVERGVSDVDPSEATAKIDYSYQVTEKSHAKALEGTTPQGREIVRKLVFSARSKLYPPKK